ncbi:MAG: desulfoferrodoxin [Clostridia bacterium]|nr:desulfoferrodoxin [Clostridia bacterium]
MSKELIIKKCQNCGAIVKVIEECKCEGCGIKCCGEEMKLLVPNSVEAVVEKHVPTYQIEGDKIIVRVNHVMEEDHYIEWINLVTDKKECTKYFKSGEMAETHFKYTPGATLYAYCNKHGLWKAEVN